MKSRRYFPTGYVFSVELIVEPSLWNFEIIGLTIPSKPPATPFPDRPIHRPRNAKDNAVREPRSHQTLRIFSRFQSHPI